MKYILIQGDGMSDKGISALGGKTPLQYADTPAFDYLARNGKCGLLETIPEGYPAGSEVGNLSILGYDVHECFEGRGPLEAASIGYNMADDDLAMRCNIIAIDDSKNIINHHGDNLTTEEGRQLIEFLNDHLATDKIRFFPGIHYRHLLVIKGGKKDLNLYPPHDNVGKNTDVLLKKTLDTSIGKDSEDTARELLKLIQTSHDLLENHPINIKRKAEGKHPANLIWPWSEGYRPKMKPLTEIYPQLNGGVMITAVDLLKGIGRYAGLKPVDVVGATGLADTNYEGKANAAIEALKENDFVFIHVEATDEASHDRDLPLKIKAIEYLDKRLVNTLIKAVNEMDEEVKIILLPDHPTLVESGKHSSEPVPFVIFQKGIEGDNVTSFDEISCSNGVYGILKPAEFIKELIGEK